MNRYICTAEERTLHPYCDNGHSFTIKARNLRQAISYARLHCRHIYMRLVNVRREKA